jgi:hypothetical protein
MEGSSEAPIIVISVISTNVGFLQHIKLITSLQVHPLLSIPFEICVKLLPTSFDLKTILKDRLTDIFPGFQ